MKKLIFIALLIASVSTVAYTQATTFILVRHAEKVSDGSKDPELSEAGKTRAQTLSKLLKDQKIDAIYATGYKRTQGTVAPLATSKALTVTTYDPMKGNVIDEMAAKYPGGTIVV